MVPHAQIFRKLMVFQIRFHSLCSKHPHQLSSLPIVCIQTVTVRYRMLSITTKRHSSNFPAHMFHLPEPIPYYRFPWIALFSCIFVRRFFCLADQLPKFYFTLHTACICFSLPIGQRQQDPLFRTLDHFYLVAFNHLFLESPSWTIVIIMKIANDQRLHLFPQLPITRISLSSIYVCYCIFNFFWRPLLIHSVVHTLTQFLLYMFASLYSALIHFLFFLFITNIRFHSVSILRAILALWSGQLQLPSCSLHRSLRRVRATPCPEFL